MAVRGACCVCVHLFVRRVAGVQEADTAREGASKVSLRHSAFRFTPSGGDCMEWYGDQRLCTRQPRACGGAAAGGRAVASRRLPTSYLPAGG